MVGPSLHRDQIMAMNRVQFQAGLSLPAFLKWCPACWPPQPPASRGPSGPCVMSPCSPLKVRANQEPSSTRWIGRRRPFIIRLSRATNNSPFKPPLYTANQNPPLLFTAEAALMLWRCPGTATTGVTPLTAHVRPCTASARKPDASQKSISAFFPLGVRHDRRVSLLFPTVLPPVDRADRRVAAASVGSAPAAPATSRRWPDSTVRHISSRSVHARPAASTNRRRSHAGEGSCH